jgi:hypothetical protein
VQRRQRLVAGESGEHGLVDQDRTVELRPAVDDAVADGAELEPVERTQPGR